jgi:hypothetical protein
MFGSIRRSLWSLVRRRTAAEYDALIDDAVRGLNAIRTSSNRISAVHDALTTLSAADLARTKSPAELRKLANHAFHGTGTEKNVHLATALWTFSGMHGDVESI